MKKLDKHTPLLIFRCLALGLGLAVLTMLGAKVIELIDAVWLLALAVTCLAACNLGEHSNNKDKE